MKIAICDDDPTMISIIKDGLQECFGRHGVPYSILEFLSGEDLVSHAQRVKSCDLVILDVKMYKTSGLQAAAQLRELGLSSKIIFVSNMVEAAPQGYEVNAYRYIIKDANFQKNFFRSIDNIINDYLVPLATLTFRVQDTEYTIPTKTIVYLESQLRKIKLVTSRQKDMSTLTEYLFYALIQEMDVVLSGGGFIRTHKSYLVNLAYIARIENQQAVLHNGNTIPISARKYTDVKKLFLKWKAEYHE